MTLIDEIMAAPENKEFTAKNWKPVFFTPETAKIVIIGQAPSKRVQDTGLMWNDASGDRLRQWLGVDRSEFYDSGDFANIPMDFYYPGKGKSGDLPPRKNIAQKWHPQLLETMPKRQLIILVGNYAQRYYLNLPSKVKLTDVVQSFDQYLPEYFPLVHPSPRNNIWLRKNPWFEQDVVPALQELVRQIIA